MNIGSLDRVVRLVLALALLSLSYGKIGPAVSAEMGWLAWSSGGFLALTGIFRYSPLYALFQTHSCALYACHQTQKDL